MLTDTVVAEITRQVKAGMEPRFPVERITTSPRQILNQTQTALLDPQVAGYVVDLGITYRDPRGATQYTWTDAKVAPTGEIKVWRVW